MNDKRHVSYSAISILSMALYITGLITSTLMFNDFKNSLIQLGVTLGLYLVFVLVLMTVKRLVTTRWGSFRDGAVISLLWGSAFFLLTSFHQNSTVTDILLVITGLGAVLVFIFQERLFSFGKSPLNIMEKIKSAPAGAASFGRLVSGRALWLAAKIKGLYPRLVPLVRKLKESKKSRPAVIGAAGLLALIVVYSVVMYFFRVDVESYGPTGEVGQKTTLRVTFEEDVSVSPDFVDIALEGQKEQAGDLVQIKSGAELFSIDPPIPGSYRLENKRTVILVPDSELKPSTGYSVSLNTAHLKAEKPMIEGVSFSFYTPDFRVTGANFFYNYDLVKNIEKEVICEINFNYPVDMAELSKRIRLAVDGDRIDFTIEPSNVPSRYYIKSSKIARKDRNSEIKISVFDDLVCIGGTEPLERSFEKTTTLPETEKLQVLRAEAFPVESNTYVAVLFNRPVSDSQIKQYVRITSPSGQALPFTVDTEYCYAILQSDFKPNQEYAVSIGEGIRSKTGEVLQKDFTSSILIEDLPPSVKFASHGKLLPLSGNLDIEFHTLNLDKFNVQINKIYRNNLVYFLKNTNSSEYGRSVLYKTYEVTGGELNQLVPHFINLRQLHSMEYRGLFSIRLSEVSDQWNYDEQYILCTDLGMIAKTDGPDLKVYVYSIKGLQPVSGVRLKLLSYDNQVMLEGVTGYDGVVEFESWKHNRNNFYPFVITAEKDEDFSFMQLSESEINTSRFNTSGEYNAEKGLKAFLTPERGVYRPGEKVYVTAIVRSHNLSAPPAIDAILAITDPRGEGFAEMKSTVPSHGMLSYEIDLPSYAPTGEYRAELRFGRSVTMGSTSFKVEDFIPDKIKAEIITPEKAVDPGRPVAFTVKGTQLFGPPAAGNRVKTRVSFVSRTFSHASFAGYSFLDNEKDYNTEFFDLGEDRLDDKGQKQYTVDIPSTMSPPSALTARVYTEVYDSGGRPVSAVRSIPVNYYDLYLGLKVEGNDVYVKGQPVDLSFVAVNPRGGYEQAKKIQLLIRHKVHYTILKRKGVFKKEYESDTYEEVVTHTELSFNGKGRYRFTPQTPGEYIIYLYRENGMRTSQKIHVQGPGMVTTNMESAENLLISLNKTKCRPGETITADILSPIPGRLFFSIEREGILYEETRMLTSNRATVTFTVRQDYLPNVYINAFVVREPDASLKHLPMTSLGIRNLEIDPGEKHMPLDIGCPQETRSDRGVSVSVRAPYGTRVVVAAVDEGILQITQFKTPDPFNFFYQKRALQTILYSVFDAILPDVRAASLAIGGDEGEYDLSRKHINPIQARRVKSVALYSGILTADADGYVRHHFDVPRFNGRLRVMAIGSNDDRFGAGAAYVTVADPIVLSPSLPRILAPEDTFEIPVKVYNKTGRNGPVAVSVAAQGPVSVSGKKTVTRYIEDRQSVMLYFQAKALKDAGRAVVSVSASMGDEKTACTTEIAVRPARSLTTITKSGALKKGDSVSLAVPADFIKAGQRVRINASPQYLTRFMGALDYLVTYPYGCSEQIASSVFPLVYYRSLAGRVGVFGGQAGTVERFIIDGLDQLQKRMLPNGEFTYWPGQNEGDYYLTMYIAHLFIEARNHGYEIDDGVMKRVLNAAGITSSARKGRLDRRNQYSLENGDIYVLYLKALAGMPDRESMEYLKNMKLKQTGYEERCLLASAYALAGDRDSARKVLPSKFLVKYFPRSSGGRLDSVVKRLSLYLSALCDIDPGSPERAQVAAEIAKYSKDGHFGTTHDNIHALVALAKAFPAADNKNLKARIMLDNRAFKQIGSSAECVTLNDAAGKNVSLVNDSDETLYYWISAEGTGAGAGAGKKSSGMSVSRAYRTSDGAALNLSSVEQGQLIKATITVEPDKETDNIIVVDLVPAGFEIENVRLRSQGDVDDGDDTRSWAYQDIRDDRLILFAGPLGREVSFTYTLRAVTVGSFVVPQVFAEAMYDPDIHATGAARGTCHVVRTGN